MGVEDRINFLRVRVKMNGGSPPPMEYALERHAFNPKYLNDWEAALNRAVLRRKAQQECTNKSKP